MDNEEKYINPEEAEVIQNELLSPDADAELLKSTDTLEDDIIRNDTIPETKDTPGSNGAFPVGAFDTSKS